MTIDGAEDRTALDVTFVHEFTDEAGKPMRARFEATCHPRVVRAFDRVHEVTTVGGTVVRMGRSDGSLFVQAPWTLEPPDQGDLQNEHGGWRPSVEHDPRWSFHDGRGMAPERPFRQAPRRSRAWMEGDERGARDLAHARAVLAAWMHVAVVVDGTPYVPTAGVTVHAGLSARGGKGALEPVLRFGWGSGFHDRSVVEGWHPGWTLAEAGCAWQTGALDLPPEVVAPPGAIAALRAAAAVDGPGPTRYRADPDAPDWLRALKVADDQRSVDRGWVALVSGDWVGVAAAVSRHHVRTGSPLTALHVAECVRCMDEAQRERFRALSRPEVTPAASDTPVFLDALSPSP